MRYAAMGRRAITGRCAMSGCEALVVIVQAARLWERDDFAGAGWLDRTFVRAILVEGTVSAGSVIVVDVGRENGAQMAFVEDNDVIEALAANRADDALSIRVLPRRTRCGDDFADIQDRDGGILLLATLFGMYPFLRKLFADGGYQGPEFQKALTKILPRLKTEIITRSDRAKGFVVFSTPLGRRAYHCLAQSLPQACQGLGEPQSQGAGILAPRLNSPHAAKTMQSSLKFSDRL